MSALETILQFLPNSKIGRQVLAETAETNLLKRRELVDRIGQLEARLAAELPALDAAIKPLEKEEAKTATAAVKAHREATTARLARSNLSTSIMAQCDQLGAELRDGASPRIRTFDGELERLWEITRRPEWLTGGPQPTGRKLRDYYDHEVDKIGEFDNSAARKGRLAAIVAARRINQEFVHAAMSEEELQAAQEKLLTGLPSGRELAEI